MIDTAEMRRFAASNEACGYDYAAWVIYRSADELDRLYSMQPSSPSAQSIYKLTQEMLDAGGKKLKAVISSIAVERSHNQVCELVYEAMVQAAQPQEPAAQDVNTITVPKDLLKRFVSQHGYFAPWKTPESMADKDTLLALLAQQPSGVTSHD